MNIKIETEILYGLMMWPTPLVVTSKHHITVIYFEKNFANQMILLSS